MAALGYHGVKISLKEDVVPTLFPIVEAVLKPSFHRTQAATWGIDDHGPPQIEAFDSILWTVVTLTSEHNRHGNLGPNDCVPST